MGRRNGLGPVFRALAHRGRIDEARSLFVFGPGTESYGLALEALCDVNAAAGDWAGAREIVETARAWAEETG